MHFLLILPQISEICYLRNLFNEDCFIHKNYAGVMINALHPMDREEKNIHNEEAWQLTRWLEEGVFGTIPCLSSRSMPSKSAIFGVWSSPSTTIPNTRTNPNCSKPTPVPSPPFSHPDAFTYPDPVNVTLEMTRNNVDKSTLSTDGVKNQAVSPLLSSHAGDVATHSHHTLQHAESATTGAMDHHAALLLRRHHCRFLLPNSLPATRLPAHLLRGLRSGTRATRRLSLRLQSLRDGGGTSADGETSESPS